MGIIKTLKTGEEVKEVDVNLSPRGPQGVMGPPGPIGELFLPAFFALPPLLSLSMFLSLPPSRLSSILHLPSSMPEHRTRNLQDGFAQQHPPYARRHVTSSDSKPMNLVPFKPCACAGPAGGTGATGLEGPAGIPGVVGHAGP